jgi:hypothetical protein
MRIDAENPIAAGTHMYANPVNKLKYDNELKS